MSSWQLILVVGGGGVVVAALWTLARVKREPEGAPGGASAATRTTIGLVGLLVGYHLVSYGLPAGWVPLRVPADRLWIAGVVCLIGVGASLWIDRLERRAAPVEG